MEDEDRYTRITLRIPKDLDRRLQESADATSKSKNAEIISRLEKSFSTPEKLKGLLPSLEALAKAQERQEIINNVLIGSLFEGNGSAPKNEVLSKAIKRLVLEVGLFDRANQRAGDPKSPAQRLLEASLQNILSKEASGNSEDSRAAADSELKDSVQAILNEAGLENIDPTPDRTALVKNLAIEPGHKHDNDKPAGKPKFDFTPKAPVKKSAQPGPPYNFAPSAPKLKKN